MLGFASSTTTYKNGLKPENDVIIGYFLPMLAFADVKLTSINIL